MRVIKHSLDGPNVNVIRQHRSLQTAKRIPYITLIRIVQLNEFDSFFFLNVFYAMFSQLQTPYVYNVQCAMCMPAYGLIKSILTHIAVTSERDTMKLIDCKHFGLW